MPTKTLLLFSGGLDSTYVLYRLLTDTDDEVTAMVLEKPEGSNAWFAHQPHLNSRIPALADELRKIRDFTLIIHPVTAFNDETEHHYTYGIAYAAPLINNGTFDRLITGRTWEQFDQSIMMVNGVAVPMGTPSSIAGQRLWDRETTRGSLEHPLVTHDYVQNWNRFHALTMLPENIKQHTFTCAVAPVPPEGETIQPCGECYKCLWDEKVQWMIDNGWNAEQVETWRKLKGLQYGGGNGLSAPMRYWLPLEMGKGIILRGLDTPEKVASVVQNQVHYTLGFRKREGIWAI